MASSITGFFISQLLCMGLPEKKLYQDNPQAVTELKEKTYIHKNQIQNYFAIRAERKLVILEALLIKEKRPSINSQAEGSDRILKILIH